MTHKAAQNNKVNNRVANILYVSLWLEPNRREHLEADVTITMKTLLGAAVLAVLIACSAEDDSGLTPLPPIHERAPGPVTPNLPVDTAPSTPTPTVTPIATPASAPAAQRPKAVTKDYFPVRRCMNMGNALESPVEGDWGYRIEAEHFRIISTAGFDTVRIPIKWSAHTSSVPPYQIDPVFMGRVQTVVAQAQGAGLGVIIDIHHYERLMENVRGETPRFLAMWDQIATQFKDAPANVYFEVINEPVAPMTMAQANKIFALAIPVIRKTNPTRPLIMGGDDWNSIDTLDSVVWPNDPYLVATFHDYGPYEFTHQGASWIEGAPRMGRTWGRKDDLKELTATYEVARRFQKRTGLPVLVGEFGVIDVIPAAERVRWMNIRRRTIEHAGMSWCAWDFAGAFKTYDLIRGDWFSGMKEALTSP